MHYPVMTEKHVADRWQVSLKTLLGIKREFKPEVPEAAQGPDAKAEDNYFTAKEIAEAASLPIHLFRDQAERNRKRVPHLMLVGNLRFSLPAILEWEMANSVVGNAAGAAAEEAEAAPEPSVPAKRWHELVRKQGGERFNSAP